MMNVISRWRALSLPVLAVGAAMLATPADAWWRGGVWIGVPPVVVAPPAYYPPAYYPYYPYPYYAPPAAYYPPAQTPVPQAQSDTASHGPVAYGAMCYAGVYNCAAAPKSPVGSGCTCPGIGAPSYGRVY
jgi:hypothetical protein